MAENIGRQVSLSRAWIPVAGVLMLIGFVPGMPNLMFLVAALVAAGAGYWSWMRERDGGSDDATLAEESAEEAASPDQIELSEIADNANFNPARLWADRPCRG